MTYTWLLVYRHYPDAKTGDAVKQFLGWCLTAGQEDNEGLGFIRLASTVVAEVTKAVTAIKTGP